jgi:hypothetical protein
MWRRSCLHNCEPHFYFQTDPQSPIPIYLRTPSFPVLREVNTIQERANSPRVTNVPLLEQRLRYKTRSPSAHALFGQVSPTVILPPKTHPHHSNSHVDRQ